MELKPIEMIVIMLAFTFSISGCTKNPGSSSNAQSTIPSNQINTKNVQMVIYQFAGYGHLPMSALWPLRGEPKEITSKNDIQSIVDALNHPTGRAFTRTARNNRLALVRQNGRVEIYGIGGGVDITSEYSSTKLWPVLTAALPRGNIVKLTLTSPVQSVSYHDAAGTTRSVSVGNQALEELLSQYSPLVLKGNRHCKADEIQQQKQKTPRYLLVKLTKPDAFDAIVAVKDSEWPPKVYDTNSRLERVSFDTITIFSEGNGFARVVFTNTRSNECLFTDPIRSLRLLKEAQGRNPPVYGPDLFDEVVSEIKKQ